MSIKPVKTAVFPVGGQGTRFLPATKAMPKEMLPVVDKPLLQYAEQKLCSVIFNQILEILIHYKLKKK
jgi:UTP--glucose-1-phosphate uridylyltransferase